MDTTTYNLLDKERTWRIIGCKVMSIMFLCITVILFIVATLFNHVIYYIASLSALVFLIFLITHLVLKKILGRKIEPKAFACYSTQEEYEQAMGLIM